MSGRSPTRDGLYEEAVESYGKALERLARAYDADPDARRDLVQDIHIALWRSFSGFNGRCSLRTWVYRIAHNVAVSHVNRQRRARPATMVGLEELDYIPNGRSETSPTDRRLVLERLLDLIYRLKPLERQVMLSYLEGLDAAAIAEVTGISPGNVATKIHRIKGILARRFQAGGQDDE